jgi:hypothetical protein
MKTNETAPIRAMLGLSVIEGNQPNANRESVHDVAADISGEHVM